MKRRLHDMARLALVVLLPLLLALAPAKAQVSVYQGKTSPLSVAEIPGYTYEWELYSDLTVDFAKVPGNCPVTSAFFVGGSNSASVKVQWLEVGIYFFKVTVHDVANCAMNLKIGMIKVLPPEIEAVISGITLAGACEQVVLDASKSIGDIIKYEWSMIDKGGVLSRTTGINTEFSLSPAFAGKLPADFRVGLKVTNRKGYVHSDTISVKIESPPVADVYTTGKLEKDGSMVVNGMVSSGTAASYRWFTTNGKIVGSATETSVKLFGPAIYSLEVTDNHGCKSVKSFKFPVEIHQIMANPDYARISWARDTTLQVLANDVSSVRFVPSTVRVIEMPVHGKTRVNSNGSITYTPTDRRPARDQFVYEVCDEVNICASATVTIDIYDSGITAPEGFSPNGDGANEFLVFRGLDNYLQSELYVYTRSGQLVYQSNDYLNNWDGTNAKSTVDNHQLVPSGTYYYILKLGGTTRTLKGFVYIGY